MLCAKEAESCPWERAKLMLEKDKLIAKCVRVWLCARARETHAGVWMRTQDDDDLRYTRELGVRISPTTGLAPRPLLFAARAFRRSARINKRSLCT